MDISDIKEDPRFADYLEEKSLRERTIENYSYHMLKYCNVTGMTPSELLDEAFEEAENRTPLWKSKLKEHLKDLADFLAEKDYTKQHQESVIGAVRNFYHWHEIQLPRPRPIKAEKTHVTIEDIPTNDEIKLALNQSSLKYKSIILLMNSSGMGSAEVRSLKVQDFLDSLSTYFRSPLTLPLDMDQIRDKLRGKLVIPIFDIVRVKVSLPYTTFAAPEAVYSILEFLELHPPDNADNYLFPATFKDRDKAISDGSLTKYFRRLNKKCGFGKVNRMAKFHSHAFRQRFATISTSKGISQWSIDAMLGHTIKDRTMDAYFKRDPTHIINDYRKVVKYLSIEEIDVKTYDSPEVVEIKNQYEKLKEKQDALEEKLQRQIEAIQDIQKE